MNLAKLKDSIRLHEGFRSKPYLCPTGHWSHGYGDRCNENDPPISRDDAEYLLEQRVAVLARRLSSLPEWPALNDVSQRVLAEMAYQLGFDGLMGFKKMWAFLAVQDYHGAAAEMLDSLWHRQTPGRSEELAAMMATGKDIDERKTL